MVKKFKKRFHVAPEGVEFEPLPDTDNPRQRILTGSNEAGGKSNTNTAGWVSYHEHIPEEASSSDKNEPPL